MEKKTLLLQKVITNGLTNQLRQLDSILRPKYINTYYCNCTVEDYGDKIVGHYCKNRWCLTCNRILTGKLINQYINSINNLDDKWFVTLTIPNVDYSELTTVCSVLGFEFTKIKDVLRKNDLKIKGMRKLEVTYNQRRDDYHPHFHLLVSGREVAVSLIDRWLKAFKFTGANIHAQDLRKADEQSVKELFKYFTKLTSNKKFIPIHALDNIFTSLYRRRVFFAYGLQKAKDDYIKNDDVDQKGVSYWWNDYKLNWFNFDDKSFVDMSRSDVVSALKDMNKSVSFQVDIEQFVQF